MFVPNSTNVVWIINELQRLSVNLNSAYRNSVSFQWELLITKLLRRIFPANQILGRKAVAAFGYKSTQSSSGWSVCYWTVDTGSIRSRVKFILKQMRTQFKPFTVTRLWMILPRRVPWAFCKTIHWGTLIFDFSLLFFLCFVTFFKQFLCWFRSCS